MKLNVFMLLLSTTLLLSGCNELKSRWQEVETGHSRKDVIRIMGQEPTDSSAMVFPMGMKGERMRWENWWGDEYLVDLAFDRVVFKSAED